MEWYNELVIKLEHGMDSIDDGNTLQASIPIQHLFFQITLEHSVKCGFTVYCKRIVHIRQYEYDIMEAARRCFERMMNLRNRDWTNLMFYTETTNHHPPSGTLPWIVDTDGLPDVVLELFRQMFGDPGCMDERMNLLNQ